MWRCCFDAKALPVCARSPEDLKHGRNLGFPWSGARLPLAQMRYLLERAMRGWPAPRTHDQRRGGLYGPPAFLWGEVETLRRVSVPPGGKTLLLFAIATSRQAG